MLQMIETMMERAPKGSHVIVESDSRFSEEALPDTDRWDVRNYPPAVLMLMQNLK